MNLTFIPASIKYFVSRMQYNRLTCAGCVRSDGDDSFFFKQRVS